MTGDWFYRLEAQPRCPQSVNRLSFLVEYGIPYHFGHICTPEAINKNCTNSPCTVFICPARTLPWSAEVEPSLAALRRLVSASSSAPSRTWVAPSCRRAYISPRKNIKPSKGEDPPRFGSPLAKAASTHQHGALSHTHTRRKSLWLIQLRNPQETSWHTKYTRTPKTYLTQGIRVWRVVLVLLAQVHRLRAGANRQRKLPLKQLRQAAVVRGWRTDQLASFSKDGNRHHREQKRLLNSSFTK